MNHDQFEETVEHSRVAIPLGLVSVLQSGKSLNRHYRAVK